MNLNRLPPDTQRHFRDTTEHNKENLPPWMVERMTPIWARDNARKLAAWEAFVRTRPRPTAREEAEASELSARLAALRFVGRGGGGGALRAASLPAARPRRRGGVNSLFGFTIHVDPPSLPPVRPRPRIPPRPRPRPPPSPPLPDVEVGLPVVLPEPELFLPARTLVPGRPRAATFPPGPERRIAPEAVEDATRMPSRIPFYLLETGVPMARSDGRRVQSFSLPSELVRLRQEVSDVLILK